MKAAPEAGFAGKTVVQTQVPRQGAKVARGARIEVNLVHYQDRLVLVPDLKGLTPEAAARSVELAGLLLKEGVTRPITTGEAALAGKVVVANQAPRASTKVIRGETIHVDLEKYIHHVSTVRVANFIGKPIAEATQEAHSLGLILRPISSPRPLRRPTRNRAWIGKTVVEWQSPTEQASVPKDTVVEIKLVEYVAAETPKPDPRVQIPNLHNMPWDEAGRLAAKTGFVLQDVANTSHSQPADRRP